MFHVKHGLLAVAVTILACTNPSDTIHVPDPFTPDQVAPGIYRLTRNLGADFPRIGTENGRVLYLARDLPGFGDGWGLYSMDPERGSVREEFPGYRAALTIDRLTGVAFHATGRTLIGEVEPRVPFEWCGAVPTRAAPRPVMRLLRLLDLGPRDGAPLSHVQRALIEPDIIEREDTPFGPDVRVRLLPPMVDADAFGANPWGPAVTPDASAAYVSDGEQVLRVALGGGPSVPLAVAEGAYPALAPDGGRLLYSRPVITDSTFQVDVLPYGLGRCEQTTVLFAVDRWETFSRALPDGSEQFLTLGAEPVFLDASTILIRRPSGLYRVDLATGADQPLLEIPDAVSAVVLSDGSIAFSADLFGGRDIFLFRP
jgi:hypothetical protein